MGRFLKCDGLCPFFIVKGDQNLIIVQINRIDECIHQRLPLVFQAHVQLAEPQQPETDKFLFDLGFCQLFLCNASFKLPLGFFELLQPFLGGAGQDTGLNRVEHILDTRFRIPELFLIEGKIGVFPVLQLHDLGDDGFHGGIVSDKLHRLIDHQIFQPLFADGFLFAALVLFGSGTFIIAVDFSCPARTTFAKHQRTAAAAVQLGCQQVIILCLSPGRGFLIFGNLILHIVEKLRGHNGGNRIGNQDVTIFQLTNIAAVAQHVLDGVESHRPAALVLDAFLVQPVPDLPHGLTIVVPLKGFSYKRCGQWVDLKTAVCVDGVSKGDCTTGEFALESIFCHATNHFL